MSSQESGTASESDEKYLTAEEEPKVVEPKKAIKSDASDKKKSKKASIPKDSESSQTLEAKRKAENLEENSEQNKVSGQIEQSSQELPQTDEPHKEASKKKKQKKENPQKEDHREKKEKVSKVKDQSTHSRSSRSSGKIELPITHRREPAAGRRHRYVLRDNIKGITTADVRRMARRGGVKRMSGLIYDETREVIRSFLRHTLHNIILYAQHCQRKTVYSKDVVEGLRNSGQIFYGVKSFASVKKK